jgi:CRISPR-associated protein Cas2
MTVVVTRNVTARTRGFLASSMIELTAGVYTAPRLSAAVRDRVWEVMNDWWAHEASASILMVWQDTSRPSGQSVRVLGEPPIELVDIDGLIVAKRPSQHADL